MYKPESPTRKGFTLIELLVVIAIIALLAAILFPVFAKAREKARQTACLSNMNQIAKGLELYKQDYEGYFPPSQLGSSGVLSWPTLMFSYIGSQDVFVCPSASETVFNVDTQYLDSTGGKRYTGLTDTKYDTFGNTGDGSSVSLCTSLGIQCVQRLSYGRNLIPNVSGSATSTSGWYPAGFRTATNPKQGFVSTGTTVSVNESQVDAPATTIHIMDAMTGTSTTSDPRGQGSSIRGIADEKRTDHSRTQESAKVAYRHSGGFNAIYGDGHAHWNVYGRTTPCDWSIQDDTCP